jgi:hypothetical protein
MRTITFQCLGDEFLHNVCITSVWIGQGRVGVFVHARYLAYHHRKRIGRCVCNVTGDYRVPLTLKFQDANAVSLIRAAGCYDH